MPHAAKVREKLFTTAKEVMPDGRSVDVFTYNVLPEGTERKFIDDALEGAEEICHVDCGECNGGHFCVFQTKGGGYIAAWSGHCHYAADAAALDAVLNSEERVQVRYKVKSYVNAPRATG